MTAKKKDLSIETLRGFAIIFMVAGHIIGGNPENGMKVADASGWRYFYFTFEYLRMPLFSVISGYVYSLYPIGDSKILKFLKGKARRILIPLLTVGTIHFLLQHFVPGTNEKFPLTSIWRIYIFPYEHFWFLQSIFLIFVSISLIDHFKLMESVRNWSLIFLAGVLMRYFIHPETDFFSIGGFLNLFPFFVLGCGIERFENLYAGKKFILIPLIIFTVAVVLQQYSWFSKLELNPYEANILSLCVAFPGIIVLFYIRKNISLMSKIGYYAYGIYLYHVFGTAGSRILLSKFGLDQDIIVFSAGLVFGLGVPVVIELVMEKWQITRRLFLGLR
ncbi:MAG: acyltransferase [Bacteroidales bacterium]|nr:acyltransferase [Bacteroidales bacterium]